MTTPRHDFPESPAPTFDIVRRGYDREQVDLRLTELKGRLTASEQARDSAEQRVRTIDEELRALRTERPMSQESFGFRAERILRMAEHEAADVRARAAKEAAAVIEHARGEAEKHRHQVEQALITRSTELDKEAAQRTVAVQEREEQAKALLAGAREEAGRIGEDARSGADKLVAEAEARAEQLRRRTDDECRRRRETAEQDLRRLRSLHEGVRTEIARLHKLLGAEIAAALSAGDAGAGGDASPAADGSADVRGIAARKAS
ncbi:hypothetical protein [Pseudonocardia sp.]|uniref:hypothetical protein n=1 Tax=Pseudonocardia sp. TaxID=60912 RepID=UPI003D1284FD